MSSKKDLRQQGIVKAWIERGACGTLEAVTGFGKTRVAILIIQEMLRRNPLRTTLVVVPSLKLYEDWTDPKVGHIVRWNLQNVSVLVINTAIRQQQINCNLLVLDEIHNYAADTFRQVFEVVKYQYILGLTATLNRLDGKDVLVREHCPVFDQVTMGEAEREGYISKFLTYNLAVDFTPRERERYDYLTDVINSTFAKFGHDFGLAKACSAGKAKGGDVACLRYATQSGWKPVFGKDHPWSPASIARYAAQWGRAVQQRKYMLYNSKGKRDIAVQILRTFAVKAITFSESTEFADALHREIPDISRVYHSNVASEVSTYIKTTTYKTKPAKHETKTKRVSGAAKCKAALQELSNPGSPVRAILTARALDEGFDVEDIELALICSATSASRQNVQRTGRAVRFVLGKTALVVNLYVPQTQDEKWLRERQTVHSRAIWINRVDEISYERPRDTETQSFRFTD